MAHSKGDDNDGGLRMPPRFAQHTSINSQMLSVGTEKRVGVVLSESTDSSGKNPGYSRQCQLAKLCSLLLLTWILL